MRLPGSSSQPPLALCLAVWAGLAALQYELVPFLRYSWGFNLWAYLPPWIGGALAAASLCVCFSGVRELVVRAADAVAAQFARLQVAAVRGGLLFLLMTCSLWRLRERVFGPDALLLIMSLQPRRSQFLFPETGATFLLHQTLVLGRLFEIQPAYLLYQFVMCVFGGLALVLMLRLARHLGPGGSSAGTIAMLVLSGGVMRVFAGHIEVYAAHLASIIGYLWLALSYIEGRSRWVAPCLALGVAIWVHGAAVLLLPGFALLPFIASPGLRVGEGLKRAVQGGLLAAVPCLVFFVAMWLFGHTEELLQSWERAMDVLWQKPEPDSIRWWVRGWGGAPSIGTDIVFLSRGHLKFLINSFFVLFPFVLPCLLVLATRRPRSLLATSRARFLVATSIPTIVYALAGRPVFGPGDWDVFSITGTCLAVLAAHLLAVEYEPRSFRKLAAWLIAFNLLFAGIPLLLSGRMEIRDAGPFAPGYFYGGRRLPPPPPAERLAPWL